MRLFAFIRRRRTPRSSRTSSSAPRAWAAAAVTSPTSSRRCVSTPKPWSASASTRTRGSRSPRPSTKSSAASSPTSRRGGKVHEGTTTEEDWTEGTHPTHAGDGAGPRRPCAAATSTEEEATEEEEEDGTGTGEILTRASATVLPTVLYPTTLTPWTRTTTAWTHRTRHRRVRRRCRCSRQRARRLPWTLAKTQLCHQTQLCPRPTRGRTIFSSPGSRPRSLNRSGRLCRT